jgi:hypothetical protein
MPKLMRSGFAPLFRRGLLTCAGKAPVQNWNARIVFGRGSLSGPINLAVRVMCRVGAETG